MKDILIKKIFLLLFCLLPLKSAHALAAKHFFDAFIGPFNIAKVDFEYKIEKNDYAVISHIATNGTADVLYHFIANYATEGLLQKNKLVTQNYLYQSQSRFSKKSKKIIYNDKGEPLQAVYNINGREKIKQLRYKEADFSDLQSVFAFAVKQFYYSGKCDWETTLFDGKRFFGVKFSDIGEEKIEENEYSPFNGVAKKCLMYINRAPQEGNDTLWQTMSSVPIYFWILYDKNDNFPFIAKIMVENTPLGDINAYTTKIEVRK